VKIEALVREAINGDKTALEGVISAIQDNVYYLALRMLVNPDYAMDATQDILIKVITSLSTFRFESQFNTWVYRIAVNHLISEKKIIDREQKLTFEIYKEDLESDLEKPNKLQDDPQYQILLNELRISCTMAMLLCLNQAHRMAYILGDILELEHAEASKILSISKENYRKQLSRARNKVINFTTESCGLVNDCAKCSCEKKLTGAVKRHRVNPDRLFFSSGNQFSYTKVKASLMETQHGLRTIALQNSINHFKSPNELGDIIEALVAEGISQTNEGRDKHSITPS